MRGRERRDGETVRLEEWEKGGRDSERREQRQEKEWEDMRGRDRVREERR